MRIRKRTPARAASPAPALSVSASPTPPPPPPPEEVPHEDGDEGPVEEKPVAPVVGAGDQVGDDRVPAIAKNSPMEDARKPELEPEAAAAAVGRCARNDGKQWRCKKAVVPGYLFCDRHVAWSTRKRKPRPKKTTKKNDHAGSVPDMELVPAAEAPASDDGEAKDEAARTPQPGHHGGGGGFHYHRGLQPADGRKRARDGRPGPPA